MTTMKRKVLAGLVVAGVLAVSCAAFAEGTDTYYEGGVKVLKVPKNPKQQQQQEFKPVNRPPVPSQTNNDRRTPPHPPQNGQRPQVNNDNRTPPPPPQDGKRPQVNNDNRTPPPPPQNGQRPQTNNDRTPPPPPQDGKRPPMPQR